MRRSLAAAFTVFIAGVLSLALAVPANAVDPWVPPPGKSPTAAEIIRKYGLDYYQREFGTVTGQNSGSWTNISQQLNETVNPSKVQPGRALVPSNVPLTGRIIEPGNSIMRPPSTYKPSVIIPGAAPLLSRWLGAAGFGMGGVSQPPGNWKEIAQAQGLGVGCYTENSGTCSGADLKKLGLITSCELVNNCAAIGATAPDSTGSPFADWFKDSALPFLDDLWAQITGQKDEGDTPDVNGHYNVVPRGCSYAFEIESRGSNNITLHGSQTIVKPRPSQSVDYTGNIWWGQDCTPAVNYDLPSTIVKTTCMDTATGKIVGGSGASLGYSQGLNAFDPVTGFNKGGLCVNGATQRLVMVQVINTVPQSEYNTQNSRYKIGTYTQWIDPDPAINFIEDTKITTTWDCRNGDGTVSTYTKSIVKTAAAVQPYCPLGSELIKHKIESATGNDVRTLDQGAEVPGSAAKYPLCLGGASVGCSMDVYIDGEVCTSLRPECKNWPAVNGTTPSRVGCHWGTYTVPTSDCYGLSNGYQAENGLIFDPHSGSWVGLDVYGNPLQPNPEPWNPTNPNPVPGGSPGTPPATGTGTGTPTFPNTGTNPATGDGCTAPGWSWNPVEWVKNPVVCALKDAFVPKTDVAGRMGTISTVLLDKPPLNWLTPPPMTGPGGGGCPNWVISIPYAGLSQNVVCDSSFTAAVVGARYPLFGLVATAMVWPLMRSIWYAAIPILRVSPGSHK